MTKTTRAAIAATFNILARKSEWIALPFDDPVNGHRVVFVHRKACTLFGALSSSDLFDADGNASHLAQVIHQIARNHGLVAASAALTLCPVMAEVAPRIFNSSAE